LGTWWGVTCVLVRSFFIKLRIPNNVDPAEIKIIELIGSVTTGANASPVIWSPDTVLSRNTEAGHPLSLGMKKPSGT
jgi:hypothetical protein